MLIIIIASLTLLQLTLAVVAPARFVAVSLLIQTIPLTWTSELETMIDTPVGRLNVIAIQAFSLCMVSLIVLMNQAGRSVSYLMKYKWHGIFLLFCGLSIAYAPSGSYGIRMIAKLAAPLLFMIAVLVAIDNERQLIALRRAIIGSGLLLAAMAFVAKALGISSDPNVTVTGLSGLGPPGMGPPVFAAHMLPVAMLAMAVYLREKRLPMLLMALLSGFCVLAALQRTSAAALLLGFAVILFLGTRGPVKVLLPLGGIVGIPLLLVFNSSFRQRMFFDSSDPRTLLSDLGGTFEQVNSSGRFGLWDEMLSRFFAPHRTLGSGIGATQEFLYRQSQAGIGVVHSEYVRLLCEVGVVGLVLFIAAAMFYLIPLAESASRGLGQNERTYALAAMGALVAYLVYMSTDNSFDYVNQFGSYVFALIAMAAKAREFGSSSKAAMPRNIAFVPANLMT